MPRIFQKPEGYAENRSRHFRDSWLNSGITGWLACGWDYEWKTPNCLPNLLRGMRSGIHGITHRMEYPCNCKENRDKIVKCAIQTNEGSWFFGKHLPGFCPGLKYRPRKRKGEKQ